MNNRPTLTLLSILLLLLAAGGIYWTKQQPLDTKDYGHSPMEIDAEIPVASIKLAYNTGSFKDERDGKTYQWLQYKGGQKWMTQNLRYRTSSSKCYDNTTICPHFGQLYNWDNVQTVCPKGWRLPSKKEWERLLEIGGEGDRAFSKLTTKVTEAFSVEFGGVFEEESQFNFLGENGNYWTDTKLGKEAWYINFSKALNQVFPLVENTALFFSCRCIEGEPKKKNVSKIAHSKVSKGKKINNVSIEKSLPITNSTKLSTVHKGTIKIKILEKNRQDYRLMKLEEQSNSIVAADLKIGKKSNTSRKATKQVLVVSKEVEIAAAYQFLLTGSAYTYLFGVNEKGKIQTYQSGQSTSGNHAKQIDADLKIGKRNPTETTPKKQPVLAKTIENNGNVEVEELLTVNVSDFPTKVVFISNSPLAIQDFLSEIESMDHKLSLTEKIHTVLGSRYDKESSLSISNNTINYQLSNSKEKIIPIIIEMLSK